MCHWWTVRFVGMVTCMLLAGALAFGAVHS